MARNGGFRERKKVIGIKATIKGEIHIGAKEKATGRDLKSRLALLGETRTGLLLKEKAGWTERRIRDWSFRSSQEASKKELRKLCYEEIHI